MQALGQVWGRIDPRAPDLKETATPLAEPRLYGGQCLVDAWRRAEDGFVVGRDIPSRALSSVLRNIVVFEPADGGVDFRVRLSGMAVFRRFGRDIKGVKMSELYGPDMFPRRRTWLMEALGGQRPVTHHIVLQQGNRMPMNFELTFLPALAPDCQTQWAIAGYFYCEE